MFGLEFLILGVVIVLVIRAINKRRAITGESAAVVMRRFFQYLAMIVALALTAFGVAGLLEAIFVSGGAATRDTALIARSVAFLVVGLPTFAILALLTQKQLRTDPGESRSLGWAMYLTIVTLGALIGVIVSGSFLLAEALQGDGLAGVALIHLAVWGGVWVTHWRLSTGVPDPERMQPARLLGSLAGLGVVLTAGSVTLGIVLLEVYDWLTNLDATDLGWDRLATPLATLIVGAAVWTWYWLIVSRKDEQTTLWTAYVMLAGVLVGVLMTVGGTASGLFLVFDWFLSDPAEGAATFFEGLPAAMGVALVGLATWMYHRGVLRSAVADRSEVHRAYDYALAGIGVVVTAIGLGTMVAIGLRAVGGAEEITDTGPTAVAAAFTLLIVGMPLWLRHWLRVERELRTDPEAYTPSISRRIYLPTIAGLGALTAMIGLVVTVYALVQNLLDGSTAGEVVHEIAIPFAVAVAGGAVAGYHGWILWLDREALAAFAPQPRLRDVILVSEDGATLAAAMSDAHLRVQRLHAAAPMTVAPSIDEVMDALSSETHERVLVVASGDHYEIVPID
ncbi:MAG: DUF5671 domain-containing protein [Acidimicrobiia bacterium]|nr:DUF5671 domain-containing protein [Acidimicrobiia bacterium]